VRFVALTLKNRAPVGAAVLVLLLGGAAGCGGGDQEVTTTPLWDVERLSFRPGRASEALGVIPAGVLVRYGTPPYAAPPSELVLVGHRSQFLATEHGNIQTNARGDVMFEGVRAGERGQFMLRDGHVDRLTALEDAGATPVAFNARGDIAGCARSKAPGTTLVRGQGFVWRRGTLTMIPAPAGREHSCAHQIDEQGLVVGETYSNDPEMLDAIKDHRWFLWKNGEITLLPADDADSRPLLRNGRILMNTWESGPTVWEDGRTQQISSDDAAMTATSMNAAGAIAGYRTDRPEGFIWDRGRTTSFPLPFGAAGIVTSMSIDADLSVLLTISRPSKPEDKRAPGRKDYVSKAFVRTAGTFHELPGLGGADSQATAFGANGEIVGWSTDAVGTHHAVRWTANRGESKTP
jgi:uncharacterized membrane protein